MNTFRQLSRRPGVNYFILGVFVLWSGMFTCLLPNLPVDHKPSAVISGTASGQAWQSDCIGAKAQTFCKSEGRAGLLVNLSGHANVDTAMVFRYTSIPPFVTASFHVATRPVILPADLFLLLCTFLK